MPSIISANIVISGISGRTGYKSIIISKDEYLLACGSYVELNPVRAKMVEEPKDYTWSSYRVYGYGKKDVLVNEHPVYLQLYDNEGERRRKYRGFVGGLLKEKEAMKEEVDRRIVYGGKEFVKDMTMSYSIAEKINRMGRQKGWRKNKENRPLYSVLHFHCRSQKSKDESSDFINLKLLSFFID